LDVRGRCPSGITACRETSKHAPSFSGRLRDELLDREIFYTLAEAKNLIERWWPEYNTVRPHSALGYRPPAPEAVIWSIPDTAGLQSAAWFGLTWNADETGGRVDRQR
jgi:hypothetical protein